MRSFAFIERMPVVDLSAAISQMAVLLIVVVVGIIATKLGYLDEGVRAKLSQVINNITLPCMIVASAGALDASALGGQIALSIGLGFAAFLVMLAVGVLCGIMLRAPKAQRTVYLFMSICSNLGFLGIPVIAALYGNETVLFSSVFIMGHSILFYSVGFGLLAGGQE